VLSGLFEMRFEFGGELRIGRSFYRLRQRLEDLPFGAVEGFELVSVKVFESLEFHLGWRC
jgi:hypothetical protein